MKFKFIIKYTFFPSGLTGYILTNISCENSMFSHCNVTGLGGGRDDNGQDT